MTRLDALLDELRAVRKTGVAFDREEHTLGICAAGVVLRDLLGNYRRDLGAGAGAALRRAQGADRRAAAGDQAALEAHLAAAAA